MGPKKLYSQLGYRMNEHLFDSPETSAGAERLQERLSCQAKSMLHMERLPLP